MTATADLTDAPLLTVEDGGTRPPRATATARIAIGLISLLYLVVGLLAVAVDADLLRAVYLTVFCFFGIGTAPWQLDARSALPQRLLLSVVTTFAVLTLPTVGMVAFDVWHPAIAFAVVAVPAALLHVIGVRRALRDLSSGGGRRQAGSPGRSGGWLSLAGVLRSPSVLLSSVGALLCLFAALTHRHLSPAFWGYLPRIGPVWYVGLALVLIGFALARQLPERALAIPAVLLLQVLTLTPALVSDGARSQSSPKHVDLIEQIRDGGGLHSSIEAYNSWPGFFSSMAWVSDVAGIAEPMNLAIVWPPLLGLMRLVALRYLFGQLLPTPWQRWVAVVLAILADAIGADYFSPQSVGFVLGLAAFGLALSPIIRSRTGQVALLLVGCTVTVTHQLSPFLIGGVLVVLTVFRQVRPWWTPALVLVPTFAWTLTHLGTVSGFLSPEVLGRLSNFRPPKTDTTVGLERMPEVTATVVGLVAGILLLGALALVTLVRNRRSARAWALAVAPVVGLVLVLINPYGQEAIFRAALFGIPWLAALAAACFPDARTVARRAGLLLTTAVLAGTFLVTTTGLDAIDVTRPADVAASRWPLEHSGSNYLLVLLGQGDLPTTLHQGTIEVTSNGLAASGGQTTPLSELTPDAEVRTLTELMWQEYLDGWDGPQPGAYALWSPTQSDYQSAYGLETAARFAQLRDAMARSPYWAVAFQGDGTVLFQLDLAAYAAAVG